MANLLRVKTADGWSLMVMPALMKALQEPEVPSSGKGLTEKSILVWIGTLVDMDVVTGTCLLELTEAMQAPLLFKEPMYVLADELENWLCRAFGYESALFA